MTEAMAGNLPRAGRAARGTRAGTGGPGGDDDPREKKLLEHALGWTLVVLVAMLVTRVGLL